MASPASLKSPISQSMKIRSDRSGLGLRLVTLSPPEPPDPARATSINSIVIPPDPPDPPDSGWSSRLLWINPSCVSLVVSTLWSTPPIFMSAPLLMSVRRDSSASEYGTRLSNFLHVTMDVYGRFSCNADLTKLRLKFLSSLKSPPSTSSVERPVTSQCASNYHSAGLKPTRVSYLAFSHSPLVSLDVCETLLGLVSKLISYAPLILLLGAFEITLDLVLGLCVCSPTTLLLDVYVTLMSLILDSYQMDCSSNCIEYPCLLNRSLKPCSLMHNLEPKLLNIDMYCVRLSCCLVPCRMLLLLMVASSMGPTPSSHAPWCIYRITRLAIGWEEIYTENLFSVYFKGPTLFSVAVFKIDKLAFVAVSIRNFSSLYVLLTFHSIMSLLKPYVVEIQGRLYSICCLGCLIASIFYVHFLSLSFSLAVNISSFVGV